MSIALFFYCVYVTKCNLSHITEFVAPCDDITRNELFPYYIEIINSDMNPIAGGIFRLILRQPFPLLRETRLTANQMALRYLLICPGVCSFFIDTSHCRIDTVSNFSTFSINAPIYSFHALGYWAILRVLRIHFTYIYSILFSPQAIFITFDIHYNNIVKSVA